MEHLALCGCAAPTEAPTIIALMPQRSLSLSLSLSLCEEKGEIGFAGYFVLWFCGLKERILILYLSVF